MNLAMPPTPSAMGSAINAISGLCVRYGNNKVSGSNKTIFRLMDSQMEYLAFPMPVKPSTIVYWNVNKIAEYIYQWMYLVEEAITALAEEDTSGENFRNNSANGCAVKKDKIKQVVVKIRPQIVI